MYGGMSHKLSMLRKKSTADVIPDPVNWSNISSIAEAGTNSNQTITGINTPIILKLNRNVITEGGSLYSKNNGSYISFASGDIVSMSNNDTLSFRITANFGNLVTGTAWIINTSNNNTLLDSFTYSVSFI